MTNYLKLLHILSMAAWLGSSLWLAGDARRSLAAGEAEARGFLRRARASLKLDRIAGGFTILSGLALIHFAQAWPPRTGLWIGFALALVRAGLTDALLSPGLRKIEAGLDAGATPAALAPAAKWIGSVAVAGQAAWLGALAGMVVG